MNIKESSDTRAKFFDKVLKAIDAQPYGVGFTKTELAEKFGSTGVSTVDKWGRLFPEIKNRIVYIKIHDGRHKQTVYVAKRHRMKMIQSGLVLEKY